MNPRHVRLPRQSGLSLVELMIALTLGLMIVAGMTTIYVANSNTRKELEKTSNQIENGRYAIQLLSEDLQLAGFLGAYKPPTAVAPAILPAGVPTALPDPCESTSVANLDAASLVHVQGYDQGAGAPTCLTGVKPGTDILVVRRVATCAVGESGCDAFVANVPYFQASGCDGDTIKYLIGMGAALASATTSTTGTDGTRSSGTGFTLRKVVQGVAGCGTTVAPNGAAIRRLRTHIYYVGSDNVLKRWELGNANNPVALVEGIENMQVEYGLDTTGDGTPDTGYITDPSSYNGCAAAAVGTCVKNWLDVMAVKVFLLARNTEKSAGYTDTKTYTLGTNATNFAPWTPSAAEQGYRRHVYSATIRLSNPAGRRAS